MNIRRKGVGENNESKLKQIESDGWDFFENNTYCYNIYFFFNQIYIGIAVEDLKFADDKDVNSKFARIKHQSIYRQLLTMLEGACKRSGVEISKVKPQFTSKIGLYKYCHQYGMEVHNGAAMVIARRSYKFKEKIPKYLKEKLVTELDNFENKNEWTKWNEIHKNIKRKVGEKPALWLINRKKILGIA